MNSTTILLLVMAGIDLYVTPLCEVTARKAWTNMQGPTKWDLAEARMAEFGGNVKDLWLDSNSDQRGFLIALLSLAFLFFLLSVLWVRWRITNRVEIRKVRHFAAMRDFIQRPEGE